MIITLDLNEKEVELLLDQLLLPDEGAASCGWRSDGVIALEEKVAETVELTKKQTDRRD